jgi:S1-C subfamily serine protease
MHTLHSDFRLSLIIGNHLSQLRSIGEGFSAWVSVSTPFLFLGHLAVSLYMSKNYLWFGSSVFKRKAFYFIIFGLAVTVALLTQKTVFAQDTLPKDLPKELSQAERIQLLAAPAVVRVVDGCSGTYRFFEPDRGGLPVASEEVEVFTGGTGSGFLVHPNGYIATNAHVVSSAHDKYATCKEDLFNAYVEQVEKNAAVEPGTYSKKEESLAFLKENSVLVEGSFEGINLVVLPNGRELPFSIRSFGDSIDAKSEILGKDVAIIKIEVEKAPTLGLSESGLPQSGSEVSIMGYPADADFFDVLDLDSLGQVSTFPGRVSAIKQTGDGVKVIQISAGVSAGISGSPVLDKDGNVIGIVSFGNLDSSGATNIPNAIPTSTLKEFIGDADGIENERGEVDRLYKEGLEQFWAKDYRKAKLTFESVKGLFEDHSEVDDLISEANREIATNEISSKRSSGFSITSLPWILGLSLGGLAIAAIGVYLGKYFQQAPRASRARQQPSNDATRVHVPPNRNASQNGSASSSWLELEYRGEIKRFYLAQAQHRLGRDTDWADLEVPNEWGVVSGRHATLRKEGVNYRIFDGDGQGRFSSNGLKDSEAKAVDGKEGCLLTHGLQLKIGSISGDKVTITFFNPASIQSTYAPTEMAR